MSKDLNGSSSIIINPFDNRLSSGMRADEALRRATNWWNNKGRREMKLQNLRQRESVGGSNKGNGGAFATLDPDDQNFLPSGIIAGKPFDDLTKREKLQVVKVWHDEFVLKPGRAD